MICIQTKAQMKEEEMSQTYCTVVGSLVKNAASDIDNATIRRIVQLIAMACDKGNDTAARNEQVFDLISCELVIIDFLLVSK